MWSEENPDMLLSVNHTPLVSVVTPTYQSAHTLDRALKSLLGQTYTNWEWIVIDDGSTDGTSTFFARQTDPRICHRTLTENQGRGFVRNLTLKEARGEFVCALDADDWFYSHKLEAQVRSLQADSSLSAVTVGMAVTDQRGKLIGVEGRVSQPVTKSFAGPRSLRSLRFPFGPTMMRTEEARETGFHTGLKRGADLDFFIRLLCERRRHVRHLPILGYVYQGHTDRTLTELLSGHRWSRQVYLRHLRRFPRDCLLLTLSSLLKTAAYEGSRILGISEWLSHQRFEPFTESDHQEYQSELVGIGLVKERPSK